MNSNQHTAADGSTDLTEVMGIASALGGACWIGAWPCSVCTHSHLQSFVCCAELGRGYRLGALFAPQVHALAGGMAMVLVLLHHKMGGSRHYNYSSGSKGMSLVGEGVPASVGEGVGEGVGEVVGEAVGFLM